MNRQSDRKYGLISKPHHFNYPYLFPPPVYVKIFISLHPRSCIALIGKLTKRRFENNQSTGGIVENNILSGAFAFGIVSPPHIRFIKDRN
jgi:hypothetical protein